MHIRKFRITKLTSGILLLIFLYNSIGYFFIFKCAQSAIKKQVFQTIQLQSPEKLKAIAFHKNDLSAIIWVEEDDELIYKGRLYDVAKTTEIADSIIYHCLSDDVEDHLYDQLDDHIKNHITVHTHKDSSKKTPIKLVKLYFSTDPLLSFDLTSFPFFPRQFLSTSYLPVYLEMTAPPPKFS